MIKYINIFTRVTILLVMVKFWHRSETLNFATTCTSHQYRNTVNRQLHQLNTVQVTNRFHRVTAMDESSFFGDDQDIELFEELLNSSTDDEEQGRQGRGGSLPGKRANI